MLSLGLYLILKHMVCPLGSRFGSHVISGTLYTVSLVHFGRVEFDKSRDMSVLCMIQSLDSFFCCVILDQARSKFKSSGTVCQLDATAICHAEMYILGCKYMPKYTCQY